MNKTERVILEEDKTTITIKTATTTTTKNAGVFLDTNNRPGKNEKQKLF